MTAEQDALVERVRRQLTAEPSVREVSMFGGRTFMVRDKLVASAGKDGGLLVRVAAEDHAALTGRPGATQAEMGAGRSTGPGWISVDAQTLNDEDELGFWLDTALRYNEAAAGRS